MGAEGKHEKGWVENADCDWQAACPCGWRGAPEVTKAFAVWESYAHVASEAPSDA